MAHATSRSLQPGQSYALQSTESTVSNVKNLQCAVSVVCNLGPGPGTCSQLGSEKQLSNCLPGYLFLTVLQLKSKLWSLGAAQLHEMALPSTKADLGRVEIEESLPGYRGLGRTAPAESLFFSVPRTTKLQNGRSYPLSRPMPRTRS